MNKNSSKQVLLSVLGVAILVVAVVGVSFAAFTWSSSDVTENKISTGTLTMTYTTNSNGINITNAMPTSDAAGMALKDMADGANNQTFKFTVAATISGTATINYDLGLAKKAPSANPLVDTDVHMYLATLSGETETAVKTASGADTNGVFTFVAGGTATTNGVPATDMKIATGSFSATGSQQYILRMWLKESYAFKSGDPVKDYAVTVKAYAKAA
ncbi:MAG: hypothetical protein RSE91_00160 [Bacilli bacterium]